MVDRSPESSSDGRRASIEDDGLLRWFLRTDDDTVVLVRDAMSVVAVVVVIAVVLFGISGVWTPLVAVESPSMEPNMNTGDLVFVVDNERFVGDGAVEDTGVVPRERAAETGHETFGQPGDVIVFRPDGDRSETPVIHRAHFWVEEGENWIDTKADAATVGDATCEQVRTCPAPHAGFVTKGDNNPGYDQFGEPPISTVVRPEWITGKGSVRIPWLGHVRLAFDSLFSSAVVAPSATSFSSPFSAPVSSPASAHGATTATAATLPGESLCAPPWTPGPCPGTQFDSSGTTTKPSRP